MTPEIKKIIENQGATFEQLLLCLIYFNREFYDKHCKYLCKAITPPQEMSSGKGGVFKSEGEVRFIDDFTVPQHNALFHVIDTYYRQISTSRLKTSPINADVFKILLRNCAIESDKGINEDELEEVSAMMADIVEMQENDILLALVAEGFSYWFKRQRVARLTNEVGLRDDWNPDDIQNELTHFNRVVVGSTDDIKTQYFGEGIDTIRRIVDRYPTGIQSVDTMLGGGVAKKEHMLVIAPTGCGKCLGEGTPVVMHNGSIKKVEDVVCGDLLMGPDSKPRRVASLVKGREMLYDVNQTEADDYVVNESHILSLKTNVSDDVCNISVVEYLQKSDADRKSFKGWMPEGGVEFEAVERASRLQPYKLGAWLGLIQKNDFFNLTLDGNILRDKYIPEVFLKAARSVRLEVLAGLLDAGGSYNQQGVYEIDLEGSRLVSDIKRLARSCGFCVTQSASGELNGSQHTRFRITGLVSDIPCMLPGKVVTAGTCQRSHMWDITVTPKGVGDYYGFTLEGPDRLFLLGDYTVTHNTVMATQLGSSFGLSKLKGMIITTEEDAEALELRIISARCGIPFKMIKDGLDRSKLTPDQCNRVDELRANLDGYLFIREWSVNSDAKSFTEELRAICENFVDEHGTLDFIIFDWIGGALTKDISNNPNMVRIIYQLAADFMADYAKEANIATISFAQAHPTQSLNKLKVDNTTISECKTMGNKASYMVGITAMFAGEEEDATFSDDQWLYFSKGRKIKNMKIPITRKFDFQKFEDRGRVRR